MKPLDFSGSLRQNTPIVLYKLCSYVLCFSLITISLTDNWREEDKKNKSLRYKLIHKTGEYYLPTFTRHVKKVYEYANI